jgi:hypothetical protein
VTAPSEAEVLGLIWQAWPDIRQLIDGWKTGTPADEWSEWDEQVRQKTIELSFLLKSVMEPAAQEGAKP